MNNNTIPNLRFWETKQNFLPLLFLVISMLILGGLLFYHVSLSKQLPLWDALSYAQKAKNFWDAVHQFRWFEPRTWFSPLNIEPTIRPPGTILMSYPFGFSDNTHGFFFRSIFIPIVLFVSALWIIAKPYCITLKDQWLLVALCLAFATLPLFYHFEPSIDISLSSHTHWGLVDNFIASVAALAAALVVRGVQQASINLTFSGIIASTFCFFVKPSGGLVMIAIFLVWAIYGIVRGKSEQNPLFHKYLISSLFRFLAVYAIGLLLSLTSNYFSISNMIYGTKAIEILKQESNISLKDLITQIHISFGWHWLALISLTCMFSFLEIVKQSNRNFIKALPVDLISALGVLLIGLWFWLVKTDKSQIRYFYPFALICIVLLFPRIRVACSKISGNYFMTTILVIPMLLLSFLLLNNNPPISLQRILGVNLTSGSLFFANEVQQGKLLIEYAKKVKRDLNVYALVNNYSSEIFGGVGFYEKILYPNSNTFTVKLPVNWINSSTFRFPEMISTDYLLLEPIESSLVATIILADVQVPDFASETELFRAWLSTNDYDSAGIAIESQTSLRLLKVIDRVKFDAALNQLRGKYKWRKTFLDANPVKWIDAETAKTLIARSDTAFQDIRFGDDFILLGAFNTLTDDGLTIELVWQSLKEQPLKYTNFVHILDSSKNIIGQADYEQDAAKLVVPKGKIWHDVIKIPVDKLKGAKTIGLGLYIPKPDKTLIVLTADRGVRDWDNQRLIFKLDKN